jgi:sigma-B regulation protein RsbU (phosphoserine phosphatase)
LILLTGLSEKQHVTSAMQAGVDDYMTKPLDPDELNHRLVVASRITQLHGLLAQQKAELERYSAQLEQEIDVARRIQTALLPRDLAIEQHALAMEMQPAAQVGGDLIDYLPQPDGRFWLAIGDVTGHGLTAGLIMMMTQSILSTLVASRPDASPRALLAQLNRTLHANVRYRLQHDSYMTLQLIRHLGDGRYVAAGLHGPILIHRAATGTLERDEPNGMWIGLVPEVDELLEEEEFQLEPGDVLLLFSDGLIEAMNGAGEQFDLARLEETLAANAHQPVEKLKETILAAVHAWLDEQRDDISLILLRHLAPAGSPALPA